MIALIVRRNTHYQQAVARLNEIHALRNRVIADIRLFNMRVSFAQCDDACVPSRKKIVDQLHASFAKENTFLRAYSHPHEAEHLHEHWILENELRLHCDGSAPRDVRSCAHVFDSFLVHHANTDQVDYREVRIKYAREPGRHFAPAF
jgi:hypothetical protein